VVIGVGVADQARLGHPYRAQLSAPPAAKSGRSGHQVLW
jgi:hypothetical protein